jgi:hypothetical protein
MHVPDDLVALAEERRGLLTTAELRGAGVSAATLRWHLGRTCSAVLPGVVALFTGALDPAQRLLAGQLWAGPQAQLASLTAARWHGFDVPDDGVVRLLVGVGSNSRREGFAVRRRTTRLDPHPWARGSLTVCSRARALIDAARELRDAEAVRQLLVTATQQRQVRERDLRHELEAGAVRGSATVRRALDDVATGAWSLPEAEVLRELATSTVLPRVFPNPVLIARDGTVLPSPDFWLDDVGLAGQVHSRQYHLRDEQWEVTVERDTLLGEYGVPVLAVTPAGFRRDPRAFRERVERAYRLRLRSGERPDVQMRLRGPGVV